MATASLSLFPAAGEIPNQEKIMRQAKEAIEKRQAHDRSKSPHHSATSSLYIVPRSCTPATISRATSPATSIAPERRPSIARITTEPVRSAVASPESTYAPPLPSSPPRAGARSPGLYSLPSARARSPSPSIAPSSAVSRTTSVRSKTPTLPPPPSMPASSAVSRSTTVRSKTPTQFPPPRKTSAPDANIRSMFPQYDPDLPLQEQHYEPTRMMSTSIPEKKLSKMPYSPESFGYKNDSFGSKTTNWDNFAKTSQNSTAFSTEEELKDLWEISNGNADKPSILKTFRLQMHRRQADSPQLGEKSKKYKPVTKGPTLTFGTSASDPFYTINTTPDILDPERDRDRELGVQINRHNPAPLYISRATDSGGTRIAEFMLSQSTSSPTSSPSSASPSSTVSALQPTLAEKQTDAAAQPLPLTHITPHLAILGALTKASQSAAATRIAAFDPLASSAAAQKLAEQAMERARQACGCPLAYNPGRVGRKPGYVLRHPQIGDLALDVEGNVQIEADTDSTSSSPASSNSSPSIGSSCSPQVPPLHGTGTVRFILPSAATTIPPINFSQRSASTATPATALPSYFASTATGGTPGTTLATLSLSTNMLTLHSALFQLCPVGVVVPSSSTAPDTLPFIADVAVSAMVGVLMAETLCPRVSSLTTFLPPPTRALTDPSTSPASKSGSWRVGRLRRTKTDDKGKKRAEEAEQGLTVAFGAAVFVLGAAVEGLHGITERAVQLSAKH